MGILRVPTSFWNWLAPFHVLSILIEVLSEIKLVISVLILNVTPPQTSRSPLCVRISSVPKISLLISRMERTLWEVSEITKSMSSKTALRAASTHRRTLAPKTVAVSHLPRFRSRHLGKGSSIPTKCRPRSLCCRAPLRIWGDSNRNFFTSTHGFTTLPDVQNSLR